MNVQIIVAPVVTVASVKNIKDPPKAEREFLHHFSNHKQVTQRIKVHKHTMFVSLKFKTEKKYLPSLPQVPNGSS